MHALSSMTAALVLLTSCTKNSSKTPAIDPLKECSADGEIDCLTTAAFPAIVKTTLVAKAAEIRSATTIGGVTGTLGDCTSDNGSSCVTSAAYPSIIKSAITAAGLMSGKVVAGITGTYAPVCTTDGQVACLTDATFKAGAGASMTVFDVRAGKTIGGLVAKLNYAKNGADTSAFNRTTGTGATASAATTDKFDSIDDYNNGDAFPSTTPSDWLAIQENFVRDTSSDEDNDTECSGVEDCVYRDVNTGLYWARSSVSTVVWEPAVTICETLDYGGYDDWRMPSQKELIQAYIDGIYSLKGVTAFNLSELVYHSATTLALSQTSNFRVSLATGEATGALKSATARTICTR